MTTIVWRDGVLAADSRAYSGDKTPIGFKKKIHRLDNGDLFGASSSKVGSVEHFMRLVNEHGVFKSFEEEILLKAIVVTKDGSFYLFNDLKSFSGPIHADYIAIGSGEEYALGALEMGSSAIEALEVAIRLDPWTGGEIATLRFEDE